MHLKSLHNSSTVGEFKNIFDAASNIDDTYTSILIVLVCWIWFQIHIRHQIQHTIVFFS